MATIKNIVLVFCLACLTSGVILQIFDKDIAKRCIKAVAGLYILVAVLQCSKTFGQGLNELKFDSESLLNSVTREETEMNFSDFSETASSFNKEILSQTESELNLHYQKHLLAEGVSAKVFVELEQAQNGVSVVSLEVFSKKEIEQSVKDKFSNLARQELAISAVVFEVENSELQKDEKTAIKAAEES